MILSQGSRPLVLEAEFTEPALREGCMRRSRGYLVNVVCPAKAVLCRLLGESERREGSEEEHDSVSGRGGH